MPAFLFEFEWDPAKAGINFSKHGVSFERAAEFSSEPLALAIPDGEHSITEASWIATGRDIRGQSILVVHTFEQADDDTARIRVISARRPTKAEMRGYEEN